MDTDQLGLKVFSWRIETVKVRVSVTTLLNRATVV